MNLKYSIVVPIYNKEKELSKCVESLLLACSKVSCLCEIILVDDGSSDNSSTICDAYAESQNIVIAYHKKNAGRSSSRNFGIEKSRGEWILFVDADDYVEDIYLERIESAMYENPNAEIYYFSMEKIYEGNLKKEIPFIVGNCDGGYISSKDVFNSIIGIDVNDFESWLNNNASLGKGKTYGSVCHSAFLREIIVGNKLSFDKSIEYGEDKIFSLSYLNCIQKCYLIKNDFAYKYMFSPGTNSITDQYINDFSIMFDNKEKSYDLLSKYDYNLYGGSCLLSAVELMYNAAKQFSYKYYCKCKKYLKKEYFLKSLKTLSVKGRFTVKKIPYLFLKLRLNFILYLVMVIMNKIKIDIYPNELR